ncbi:unnamed protein product, partial [Prorocentrum cordatum]
PPLAIRSPPAPPPVIQRASAPTGAAMGYGDWDRDRRDDRGGGGSWGDRDRRDDRGGGSWGGRDRSRSRGGDRGGGGGKGDSKGSFSNSDLGANLKTIHWRDERLVKFEKDFYQEHPAVAAMTPEQADYLRKAKNITIVSGDRIPKPVRSRRAARAAAAVRPGACHSGEVHR